MAAIAACKLLHHSAFLFAKFDLSRLSSLLSITRHTPRYGRRLLQSFIFDEKSHAIAKSIQKKRR